MDDFLGIIYKGINQKCNYFQPSDDRREPTEGGRELSDSHLEHSDNRREPSDSHLERSDSRLEHSDDRLEHSDGCRKPSDSRREGRIYRIFQSNNLKYNRVLREITHGFLPI